MQTNEIRPPGPVVPGWTRAMTHLSPVRLEFDSLSYIVTNAEKFGELYGVYLGDTVTYVHWQCLCDDGSSISSTDDLAAVQTQPRV